MSMYSARHYEHIATTLANATDCEAVSFQKSKLANFIATLEGE